MNPRQRRGVLFILLSVVIAVVVFFLVASYVGTVSSKVGSVVTVYRAADDLPAYTTLDESTIVADEVPERWLSSSARVTQDELLGRKVGVNLEEGTMITTDILVPPSDLSPTEREIAINVDPVTGIAGRIVARGPCRHLRGLRRRARPAQAGARAGGGRPRRLGAAGARCRSDEDSDTAADVGRPRDARARAERRAGGHLRLRVREGGPAGRPAGGVPARTARGEEDEFDADRPRWGRRPGRGAGLMAGTVVIGCADQSLAYELRSRLAEAADVEVVCVAETTTELADLVLRLRPRTSCSSTTSSGRSPCARSSGTSGCAARDAWPRRHERRPTPVAAAAMDAGARGVLAYPLTFEDVQQRVDAAVDWSRHMESLLIAPPATGGAPAVRATVVAVTGTKGGVGTTTLVTHLGPGRRARGSPAAGPRRRPRPGEGRRHEPHRGRGARTSVADLAKVARGPLGPHRRGRRLRARVRAAPAAAARRTSATSSGSRPPRSARSSGCCASSTTWCSSTSGPTSRPCRRPSSRSPTRSSRWSRPTW